MLLQPETRHAGAGCASSFTLLVRWALCPFLPDLRTYLLLLVGNK